MQKVVTSCVFLNFYVFAHGNNLKFVWCFCTSDLTSKWIPKTGRYVSQRNYVYSSFDTTFHFFVINKGTGIRRRLKYFSAENSTVQSYRPVEISDYHAVTNCTSHPATLALPICLSVCLAFCGKDKALIFYLSTSSAHKMFTVGGSRPGRSFMAQFTSSCVLYGPRDMTPVRRVKKR
jgi:hypothetical protein